MKKSKRAGFLSYLATPLMSATVLLIASLVFLLIFKDPSPVPIFATFFIINTICMLLYAVLPFKLKNIARYANMIIVGSFLLILVQFMFRDNLQIESFFFYIFALSFGGVFVHFANAKIIGPLFAGRNWCSWGCWNAMIFDLLPFKKSTGWKSGPIRYLKYIHFAISLALVALLFYTFDYSIISETPDPEGFGTMYSFYWALGGNLLYYLSGIIFAIVLKDNRAFCKYLCPVSIFLKFSNKISLLKIKGKQELCDNCNTCQSNCLMNIKIPEYIQSGQRVKADECIMCMKCVSLCPQGALSASVGLDFSTQNKLV